ncbi:MAG: CvpA family protein [bacterium]|nr:CvpA family protein [bacterium]
MTFTPLDVILILIVFGFLLFGLWFGLIYTFGALIGTVVGAFIAGQFYTIVPGTLPRLAAFIIIFLIVSRLVGFGFSLLDKAFHILSIIPFLKSINRLGGGIFGLLEGVLVVGTILIVASRYNLGSWFTGAMTQSKVAPSLVSASQVILPFLPIALKKLQSFIPWLTF